MVAVAAKMEEILSAQTLMIFGMLFRRFALHNAKSCNQGLKCVYMGRIEQRISHGYQPILPAGTQTLREVTSDRIRARWFMLVSGV